MLAKRKQLILSSTENIIGSNGGTIITQGGINIQKDLYVGGNIITPTNVFMADNGVSFGEIPNFKFNSGYFTAMVYVSKQVNSGVLNAGF